MFLKLHDIEDSEKKDFILETLRREFRDVAIEARKVFKRFNKLGSHVEVVGTSNEETQVPIPSKLLGLHEAFENNFDWICPKNLVSDLSEPKRDHKVTRVNSTNVLDEGLRIGEIGHRMNLKVKSVKQGVYRK
jgi:hypothetical protein